MPRNVVLIGFMGAGKSAVGRALAERLGFRLYDTDAMVEESAGRTIADVWDAEGEEGFRAREHDAVLQACAGSGRVIACGGGAVLEIRNYGILKGAGSVVYLRAPADVVRDRGGVAVGRPLVRGPGAASKSAVPLESMWRWLAAVGMRRPDVVAALGGGVVGDAAGFAAATYHRGVPLVQMPTTLLGQIDSAIGGKTAIDLPEGKNLVGAFHQPRAVVCDTTTLQTLPDHEFATGMAEAIKHALIAPGTLADRLTAQSDVITARDPETLATLVVDAAAVKVRIVEEDQTEQAGRAFLNYGHTLAHAVEALAGYAGPTHGEAVA